jgi:hypothetical protein
MCLLPSRRRPRRPPSPWPQVAQGLSAFGDNLQNRQLEFSEDACRATRMLAALAYVLADGFGAAGGRRQELMSGPLGPPLRRLAQLLDDSALRLAPGAQRYAVALLQAGALAGLVPGQVWRGLWAQMMQECGRAQAGERAKAAAAATAAAAQAVPGAQGVGPGVGPGGAGLGEAGTQGGGRKCERCGATEAQVGGGCAPAPWLARLA